MKCPACELLTSDGKDECPRCQLDFRPYKERLGIHSPTRPNSASAESSPAREAEGPELPFEYFQEETEVQARRPKPRQPKKIDLSDLIAGIEELRVDDSIEAPVGTTTTSREEDELQELIEAIDTMGPGPDNADLSDSNLAALNPDAHQLFAQMQGSASDQGQLGGTGLELFGAELGTESILPPPVIHDLSHMLEEEEEEEISESAEPGVLDDDALFAELASALESSVEQAHSATASLQEISFDDLLEEEAKAPTNKKEEKVNPYAPKVVEFGDDEELFDKQLDAMLGDETLNVEAVKEEKPSFSPILEQDSASLFLEDDLEISFEVEVDDEVEEKAPEEPIKEEEQSDMLLSGLLDSFNELDSSTEHKEVVEPQVEREDAKDLLGELEADLGLSTTDSAASEGDELSALHAELESELAALEAEGTSFLGDEKSLIDTQEEKAKAEPELPDELAALSAELGAEISALEAEGSTFFQGEEEVVPSIEEEISEEEEEFAELSAELDKEIAALEDEGSFFSSAEAKAATEAEESLDFASVSEETPSYDEEEDELAGALSELLASEELLEEENSESAILDDLDFDAFEEDASSEEDSLPDTSFELDSFEQSLSDESEQEAAGTLDASQTGIFLASDFEHILGSPIEEQVTENELEEVQEESTGVVTEPEQEPRELGLRAEPGEDPVSEEVFSESAESLAEEAEKDFDNFPAADPLQNPELIDASQTGVFLTSDLMSIVDSQEEKTESEEAAEEVIEHEAASVEEELQEQSEVENVPLEASQTGAFLVSDLMGITEEAEEEAQESLSTEENLEDSIELNDAPSEEESLEEIEEKEEETYNFDSSQTGAFLSSDLMGIMEEAEQYADTLSDDELEESLEPEQEDEVALEAKELEETEVGAEAPEEVIEQEVTSEEEELQEQSEVENIPLEASQTGAFLVSDLMGITEEAEEEVQESLSTEENVEDSTEFNDVPVEEDILEEIEEKEEEEDVAGKTGMFLLSDLASISAKTNDENSESTLEGEEEPPELQEERDDLEQSVGESVFDSSMELHEDPAVDLQSRPSLFGRILNSLRRDALVLDVSCPEEIDGEEALEESEFVSSIDANQADSEESEMALVSVTEEESLDEHTPESADSSELEEDVQLPRTRFNQGLIQRLRSAAFRPVPPVEEEPAMEPGSAAFSSWPMEAAFSSWPAEDREPEPAEEEEERAPLESPLSEEIETSYEEFDDEFEEDEEDIYFSSEDISFTPEDDEEEDEEEYLCDTAEDSESEEDLETELEAKSHPDEIKISDIRSLFSGEEVSSSEEISYQKPIPLQKSSRENQRPMSSNSVALSNQNIAPELWQHAASEIEAYVDTEDDFEISVQEMMGFRQNDKLDLLFDLVKEEIEDPEKRKRHQVRVADSDQRVLEHSRIEKAVVRYAKDQKKLRELQAEIEEQGLDEFSIPVKGANAAVRLLAFSIDAALCVVLTFFFASVTILPYGILESLFVGELVTLRELLPHIFDLCLLGYMFWLGVNSLLVALSGSTFGGRLCRIEVMNDRGFPASFSQSLVRSMLQVPNALLLGIGTLPTWRGRMQSLPDVLCRTQTGRRLFEVEMHD